MKVTTTPGSVFGPSGEHHLRITGATSQAEVTDGDKLTYIYTVTNNAALASSDITFTDTLPVDLHFLAVHPSQGQCEETDGSISCLLGPLDSQAAATVEVFTLSTATGDVVNEAGISVPLVEADQTDNSVAMTTSVVAPNQVAGGVSGSDSGGSGAIGWIFYVILLMGGVISWGRGAGDGLGYKVKPL